MKTRKLLLSALCFIGAAAGLVGFSACQTDNPSDHEHNYSENWTYDEQNLDLGHWHKCDVEGCVSVNGLGSHTWDNGTATKTATCFAEGEITYKCTVCQATRSETVEQLSHSYSDTWSKDGANHWHACTRDGCSEKKDSAAHTWNSGVITKQATCFEEGVTTYTCTVCGQTKTEAIEMIDHTFATEWSKDSTGHWYACTVEGCNGKDAAGTHTFGDWIIDSRYCSTCDFAEAREHEHSFSTEWSKDGTNHWYDCTVDGCDEKKDSAAHTWNNGEVTKTATCFEEGVTTYTCTVCGQTKTEAIEMIDHTFATEWSKDGTGHWYACTVEGCNGKDTVHSHDYGEWQTENSWLTDTRTCSECNFVDSREHVHSYSEDWSNDGVNHWHVCTEDGCPVTTEHVAHTKVWHSAEGQHWQTCETCDYESEKADHTYNDDMSCECDDPTAGLVYTITDNEAALTYKGEADDTASLVIIASYVKDVDGVAVPCSADDKGAVPVTSIAANVFVSFDMVEVFVPATVKTLRTSAFMNCRKLATVRTAAKFTRIEQLAFKYAGYNATQLTGIDLSEATLVDQEAFSWSKISGNIDLSSISAFGLGSKAFENCTLLKSVKIGPKLQRLASGNNFLNCTNLESVELECDLQDLGGSVFSGCSKLKTFKYKTIQEISSSAFKGCSKLESFDFTNVGRLYNNSFQNTGLKSLTIPSTLTYTASSFTGSPVTTVTFSEGVTSITTLISLSTIETVNLPSTLTSLPKDMFKDCTALSIVNYNKNMDDFNALTKGENWDGELEFTVKCKDGDIAIEKAALPELIVGENSLTLPVAVGSGYGEKDYTFTVVVSGTYRFKLSSDLMELAWSCTGVNGGYDPWEKDPGDDGYYVSHDVELTAGMQLIITVKNYDTDVTDYILIIEPDSLLVLTEGENSLTLDVAVDSSHPGTQYYVFTAEEAGTYEMKWTGRIGLIVSYIDEEGNGQSTTWNPSNNIKVGDYYVASHTLTAGQKITVLVRNASKTDKNFTLEIEFIQPIVTPLTENGTVTGSVNANSAHFDLEGNDDPNDYMYIDYYTFTATQNGTLEITVDPDSYDTAVFISLISFADIVDTLGETYVGFIGEDVIPNYTVTLSEGDTVYLWASNLNTFKGNYSFTINFTAS